MQEFEGSHLVFVAAGSDPFDVITNAVKYVLSSSFLQLFLICSFDLDRDLV